MTDTKKLIEEARKLAEQQREEAIVKEAIELSLSPASPTVITPQEAFDGTWDSVLKIAKLQVSAAGNTPVNLATMDASTDDKKLVSNGRVYEIANYEVGLVKVIDSAGNVKDLNTIDGKTAGGNYHLVTKHYVDEMKADKAFESIEDLSGKAKTIKELYNLVEDGKWYIIDSCVLFARKKVTYPYLSGIGPLGAVQYSIRDNDEREIGNMFKDGDELGTFSVNNPVDNYDAANKKYVDDRAASEKLTLHWDDGSTDDIKVGK